MGGKCKCSVNRLTGAPLPTRGYQSVLEITLGEPNAFEHGQCPWPRTVGLGRARCVEERARRKHAGLYLCLVSIYSFGWPGTLGDLLASLCLATLPSLAKGQYFYISL